MTSLKNICRNYHTSHQHPQVMFFMNDKVRESFYLANASLNNHINWFIQSAHELIFPDTVKNYERSHKMNSQQKAEKLRKYLLNARDEVEYAIYSMKPCNMLMEVHYPVRRVSGHIDVVKGFVGQHCVFDEKYDHIGGFRICPKVNSDCVEAMSILSSYKNALYNIELAGAHFAIRHSPESLQTSDLQKVIENYIHELRKRTTKIRPLNLMELDMNTELEHLDWINELNIKSRDNNFLTVGSNPNMNYEDAGGRSTLFFLKEFLNDPAITGTLEIDTGVQNKTFILEGFGKLGYSIGKLMEENGAICVGIKEKDCSVYNDAGISIEEISEFKRTYGTLIGCNDKVLSQESPQIYTEPCDLIILAATHRTLQCYNADRLKAKVIVEAANCAITPSACKKLSTIGKLVIPDLLAGAGPTILAYIEYMKNFNKKGYDTLRNKFVKLEPTLNEPDLLNTMLENTLQGTLDEILVTRNRYNLLWDFKMACYVTSIQNIFNKRLCGVDHKKENSEVMQ